MFVGIINIYKYLFAKHEMTLFHPESPGVKVVVLRNRVQNFFRSKVFAGLGEDYIKVKF